MSDLVSGAWKVEGIFTILVSKIASTRVPSESHYLQGVQRLQDVHVGSGKNSDRLKHKDVVQDMYKRRESCKNVECT
jgi:hypothetical protein